MRWNRLAVFSGICLSALVQQAHGQAFPFQLSVQQGTGASTTIPNGATVNLVGTGVGVATKFTLTATYIGSTTAVFSTAPQITGSSDFTAGAIQGLPLTLQPGGSFSIPVTYTPASASGSSAQLTISFSQSASSASGTPTSGTIGLNISGTVPQFLVNYALQANSNIVTISNGGTIQFLPTPVGTIASATVILVNRGSGAGAANSITVTGSAFQPIGLPLLPASVGSGGNLQFGLQYTPSGVASADVGGLTIGFSDGTTFTAVIQGSGTGATYAYTLINNGTNTPITPGQTVTLPSIAIGQSESATIQVQNTGNANGTVSVIALAGAAFSLANVPATPLILTPNASTLFTLNVTPTVPGPNNATLRIGNDLFTFTVSGIGPNLVYSYVAAGTTTTIVPGNTVVFSPVAVSQNSSTPFSVTNTGTSAALISSIGIAGAGAAFTLTGVPALPLNLQPNATISFSIFFAPTNTGQVNATLLVNAQPFTLLGFGSQPPPLPSYQIVGPSGQVSPSQQPTVGLTLSQTYPLTLVGTLTIQVTSNSFASDPAVQFSSGGTTALFSIPAGQTQAVFANGSNSIRFQTGTVSGGITISPTFTTSTGISLTPANPTVLQITVPSQAPVLLTAVVAGVSATGFVVTMNGYVTSRSVTTLNFTFSAASGQSATPSLSLDVSQGSSLWFSSAPSIAFGGQFSIAVPFTLQGLGTTTNVATVLRSVSVTAANSLGVSNSVTATLP